MKETRRSFLTSCTALLLCFCMLLGSTFAWFTDVVTSSGNKIVSGNLDLDLQLKDKENGSYSSINESSDPLFNYDKWEPGYTDIKVLRVANVGSLSFKWVGNFVSRETITKLAEVIDVYVKTSEADFAYPTEMNEITSANGWKNIGTLDKIIDSPTQPVSGQLLSGESDYFAVALHMQEDAGNEYQDTSLGAFDIAVHAAQYTAENDSFGNDYDQNSQWPNGVISGSITASGAVTTDEQGKVASSVTLTSPDGKVSAVVPAGTQLEAGATNVTVIVSPVHESQANVTLGDTEKMLPVDVHVDGVAENNNVAIPVYLAEWLEVGLNIGNYKLYHVEDGITNEMTLRADNAIPVHNNFDYDPATGDVTLYLASFSEVAMVADTTKAWGGTIATGFASGAGTEEDPYIIANADQLAYFGAAVGGMVNSESEKNSFSGKFIKLVADINLGDKDDASTNIFYPIGYYNDAKSYEKPTDGKTTTVANVTSFSGTFDGNGHTIANIYQNTWQMWGNYDGNNYKAAMGLFGYVNGGTVRNLTVDNFSSDGEFTPTGVIAAYSAGDSTFENIAITNCNPRVYNTGNGGIIGIAGDEREKDDDHITLKNITVDNSNKISALWGSYDVACGGLVGMYRGNVDGSGNATGDTISFENCHVSAQIDAYNDVCANYQYYAYRYSGMIIGSVRHNTTNNEGKTIPNMTGISAKGCTVHFGTWNDYYYCEIVANSLASYTHDHQFSRLVQVLKIDTNTKKYLPLGREDKAENWVDVSSSGWAHYVVVNGEHASENATCYHFNNGNVWNHADAGTETVNGQTVLKEDNQHIYLEFNNLFTGYGWGVSTMAINKWNGITALDVTTGEHEKSVEKFEGTGIDKLYNEKGYKLGDIFNFVNKGVELVPGALTVSITNLDENNPVSATISYDRENWENSTISFTGVGEITITIQDYYFCTPTTITVNVKDREPEVKFDVVMKNGDFLHRVGNVGTVALDKLFKAKDGVTVGTVSVTVEAVGGTGASGTYSNNAIQFSGTGVVKVTITDNDYCIPTDLYLEVVDAVNATGATNATSNNVVLLNDAGFSSFEVSGGYTLYGNGFTLTCGSDSAVLDFGSSFVTLDSGTLDNVQIVCPNFDYAALYKSNLTSSENRSQTTDKTRYYNAMSGVMVSGNSQILNSRISGARAAVNVTGGNCVIDNSRLEGGAVASLLVGSANSVTLRDVTLVQKPTPSTYDSSKTLMGFSVLFVCDANGNAAPVTLEGTLVQNAWVDENDKQYVPSAGQSIISTVLAKTEYLHDIDGDGTKESLNLGFAYMPESLTSKVNATTITDNRTNKDSVPYDYAEVSILNGKTYVYSYKNSNGTVDSFKIESTYVPNKYSDIITVTYSDTADGLEAGKSYGTDGWVYELNVDLDKLSGYAFDFSKLSMTVNGVPVTEFKVDGNAKPTSPVAVTAGGTTYKLTATIDGKEYTAIYKVTGTETSKESPSKISGPTTAGFGVAKSYGGDWSGAADVLTGVKVKYWSVAENKYVEFDFSDFTVPGNAGKLNGANSYWEYTHTNNDFTLKVTNTVAIHSGKSVYGMPIRGTDGKLYFTISSTNGYVGSSTTSRAITMQYEFTDNNGGEKLTFTHTFNISYNAEDQYSYSDLSGSGKLTKLEKSSSGGGGCVTPDTLITLADGTQVRVDSLTGDEMLLVWNLETGKFDKAPIMFVDSDAESEYEIIHLYFSDGTDVKIIYEHGFWDYDLNKYVYLDRNAADYIGHTFAKQNGDKLEKVQLTDVVIETEVTTAWSPVTVGHLCYFVNGMLSMPGGVGGLFNIFEVDAETMTYDYEQLAKDIETYGLFTYEELNAICPLSEEMFNAAGGAYLKISIGKGNLTIDELIYMINRYSKFI